MVSQSTMFLKKVSNIIFGEVVFVTFHVLCKACCMFEEFYILKE